jgi:transposase
MARYRATDAAAGQGLFLAVNLQEQLLPGSFEYMLNEIINTKIDTGIFDKNYKNDKTGASAIPPSILLKLIIYGYSKGRKSSRSLEELNKHNIIAKALTGDMNIHFTSIADFISMNSAAFSDIFLKVLMYCNGLGLIGGETFAIDGLRLPSNASLAMSGTKADLEKKVGLYRKMAAKHLSRHLKKDAAGEADNETQERFEKRQKILSHRIAKFDRFLEEMEPKEGRDGQEIQSNVTDNESAMIRSSKGTVQGYIGIAVSDKKKQVIIGAQAVGSANEGEHLALVLDGCSENMQKAAGKENWDSKKKTALCDANYFSEENLRACGQRGIEAIIPDNQGKRLVSSSGEKRYEACDFTYHEEEDYYECPQGKRLKRTRTVTLGERKGKGYEANPKDCRICPRCSQCIRSRKEQSKLKHGRQLLIMKSNEPGSLCSEMRNKLEQEEYQDKYAYRIQIVEPVFANIGYCKGLNRFTLRGKIKVNGQWLLYCIVHNLGKCLNGYNGEKNFV